MFENLKRTLAKALPKTVEAVQEAREAARPRAKSVARAILPYASVKKTHGGRDADGRPKVWPPRITNVRVRDLRGRVYAYWTDGSLRHAPRGAR